MPKYHLVAIETPDEIYTSATLRAIDLEVRKLGVNVLNAYRMYVSNPDALTHGYPAAFLTQAIVWHVWDMLAARGMDFYDGDGPSMEELFKFTEAFLVHDEHIQNALDDAAGAIIKALDNKPTFDYQSMTVGQSGKLWVGYDKGGEKGKGRWVECKVIEVKPVSLVVETEEGIRHLITDEVTSKNGYHKGGKTSE